MPKDIKDLTKKGRDVDFYTHKDLENSKRQVRIIRVGTGNQDGEGKDTRFRLRRCIERQPETVALSLFHTLAVSFLLFIILYTIFFLSKLLC